MIFEKFLWTFSSVCISEGNFFSSFATVFLLCWMAFMSCGFDSRVFLICLFSLDFLVSYSWIDWMTFSNVFFLDLSWECKSSISVETVFMVNSSCFFASPLAKDISSLISSYFSFSLSSRFSACSIKLVILSRWANFCCKTVDMPSNSERKLSILCWIEFVPDTDFLYSNFANLNVSDVLVRFFLALDFFCFSTVNFFVSDAIPN